MTAPTYRLPAWLGGHEVKYIGPTHVIDGVEYVCAYTDQGKVMLPRGAVVEVKPPSINDPVALPVVIVGDGATLRLEDYGVDRRDRPVTDGRLSLGALRIDLTDDQLLQLARAAWRLGTGGAS